MNSPRALAAVLAASSATLTTSANVSETIPNTLLGTGTTGTVTAGGSFDMAGSRGSLHLSAQDGSLSLPVLYLPRTAYLEPPLSANWGVTAQTPWLQVDLTGGDINGGTVPMVGQVEQLNPVLALDELSWGATTAAEVGPQTVDGAAVTHYVVSVNLQTVLASPQAAQAPAVEKAARAQLVAGNTVTFQVSVDGGGHLVQLAQDIGAGAAITTTLSHFGVAVSVQEPAAGQSVDVAVASGQEKTSAGDGDAS